MTPRTRLGRCLLTGGDTTPHPRDACRTPEDVDATVAALGRELTPEERADVAEIKAVLGKAGVRR